MGTSQSYDPNPGDRDTMTAVLRGAVNARVQGNRYDDHHMALMGC
jgi:hypothetical protein